MNNQFWNKWNDEFRGYGEPTNNYNQNTNHQQYQNWSNNWGTQKQNNTSWDWNYFNDTLKEEKKRPNPSKSFNPQEFINTEFMNTNGNWRNSGKQSLKWESHEGAVNTDYTFTNYGVNEGFKQASSGLKWNDPTNRVNNNYIEHWDDETQKWYKVVAVNKDVLNDGGYNVWNSPIHNSILEVELDNGEKFDAIVQDHCGASSHAPKIDIWKYKSTPDNYTGKFTVKRKGGKTNYDKH